MGEFTESIYIDCKPDVAHRFILDPTNTTLWQSNLVDYELLDDRVRKGALVRGVSKVAGRSVEWQMEYAELDPGHRTVLRSVESPIAFTIEETFEADGDGTTLTWHQESEPFGGFFGRLADPLVVRLYRRDVRSNLDNLKLLLENCALPG